MADRKPFLDFKAIKARVPFAGVLARYNVELKRVNNSSLKGKCPLPSHSSKSSDTFYVNEEKAVWYCHSDSCKKGGHRAGGNVIDFVQAMSPGFTAYDAAKLLDDWYPATGNGSGNPATEPAKTERGAEGNKPLAFQLKDVNPSHPFIQGKGISAETAAMFGVGVFPGKGSMQNRCVFPLYENLRRSREVTHLCSAEMTQAS